MYRYCCFLLSRSGSYLKPAIISLLSISILLLNTSIAFGANQTRVTIDPSSLKYSDPSAAFVSGTVSPAFGQRVRLYSSETKEVIGSVSLSRGDSCSFSIRVPEGCLKGNASPSLLVRSDGAEGYAASRYIPLKIRYEQPASRSTTSQTRTPATKPTTKSVSKPTTKAVSKPTTAKPGKPASKPAARKPSASGSAGSYTIRYYPMGGTGTMKLRKAPVGETIKLNANQFKRDGYEFVGWALKSGMANRNGQTNIEKFSNIDMKHFQLGKPRYSNGEYVRSLASKGKTITLYACWKGKGRIAAMDWAKLIAADNEFHYGLKPYSQKGGCYFCGSQYKKSGKLKNRTKTSCCQPFIESAYTHGANFSGTAGKCRRGTVFMPYDYKNSPYFSRVSYKNARPGDVICCMGNDHIGIYVGNGAMVDSSNGDNNKKYSKSWNVSISSGYHKVKWHPGPIRVYRFKY